MYRNLAEVQKANKANGNYWFSPLTMQFFKCKIESGLIGGRYFVTSEQMLDAPRRYTIREVLADADIGTVGEFQGYSTARQAKKAARDLTDR